MARLRKIFCAVSMDRYKGDLHAVAVKRFAADVEYTTRFFTSEEDAREYGATLKEPFAVFRVRYLHPVTDTIDPTPSSPPPSPTENNNG